MAVLLLMAACSKDKDIDTPARLTPFAATLKVERVWTAKVADKGAKVQIHTIRGVGYLIAEEKRDPV